ncbi:DUF502 domain-containing protein [Teredinibacter haidensis]|uniref:DUF502 domain-containing protein n=1 Tax=Teredinibacter haidensis TaxID=2731755 RepID=UPI000948B670|nr:DUF502 domain-containing protein [Teredinibacter haidensis]
MEQPPTDVRPGLLSNLGKTFFAGLLAALPLALTLVVIVWFGEMVHRYLGPDSFVGGVLGSIGLNFVTTEITAYAIGLGSVVLVVYLLGVAVEAGLKNHFRALTSGLINRVPLVRSIYQTLSKLMAIFDKQDNAEFKSMSAVMCFFGGDRKGTAVLALLTNPHPICFQNQFYYSIIIPTAPVPFGGAILYVPVDWVEKVGFGFDGLVNIYMSMGVTSPDYFK